MILKKFHKHQIYFFSVTICRRQVKKILVQFETIAREYPALLLLIQNFLKAVVEGGATALNAGVVQVHAIDEGLSL